MHDQFQQTIWGRAGPESNQRLLDPQSDSLSMLGTQLQGIHEPPHDKTNKMAIAPSEDTDHPVHPPSLISLRCPHEQTLGPQLPIERTMNTLIRLGGCPGWSESSLGTKAILLVLSWGGSHSERASLSSLVASEKKTKQKKNTHTFLKAVLSNALTAEPRIAS